MSEELISEESNMEFHCGCVVIGQKFHNDYHEDKWSKWDELSESLRDKIKQIQLGNSVQFHGDIIGTANNNQLKYVQYKNINGNIWIEDDAGSIKVDFGAMCDIMNSILMSAVCPIEIWYECRKELLNCKLEYIPSYLNHFLSSSFQINKQSFTSMITGSCMYQNEEYDEWMKTHWEVDVGWNQWDVHSVMIKEIPYPGVGKMKIRFWKSGAHFKDDHQIEGIYTEDQLPNQFNFVNISTWTDIDSGGWYKTGESYGGHGDYRGGQTDIYVQCFDTKTNKWITLIKAHVSNFCWDHPDATNNWFIADCTPYGSCKLRLLGHVINRIDIRMQLAGCYINYS